MNRGLLAAVVMTFGSGPVLAADWTFDPRIALSGVYNDNHRLTEVSGQEIKVSGARLDALVAVRAETPRSSLQFLPRIRSTFYPGDEQEEADDQFVQMVARHSTERATLSLNLDYSRVVTQGDYFPSAEIADDDELGEPDRGVGVGRIGLRNRQERASVSPAVVFEINPRQSIEARAEYLDTRFDIQVPGDRVDFKDLFGSVGFRHALSETGSVAIRAAYSTYDPDDGAQLDTQLLDAEWRNRISETSEIYVRGGASRVESEALAGGGSTWETGFTGGVGVRWGFQVTQIWLDASRKLDPNSAGDIVGRDEFRVQISRRLSPVTNVIFGGRLIQDQDPGEGNFTDRTYVTGSISFEWRVARAWSLVGSYDYAWREYDGAPTDAESNAVSLGFVYQPRRR